MFHLHGDTYELPPDATNLARSPMYEQQAFRWGDIVYGFQFHLEFTEPIIPRLAQEPQSQRYMTEAGADLKQIITDSPGHVRALTDTAQRVFENYFSSERSDASTQDFVLARVDRHVALVVRATGVPRPAKLARKRGPRAV